MSESEQNKTEEPTPFKLKQAREKGNVARGSDLAFFGLLVGLGIFFVVLGPQTFKSFSNMMRTTLLTGIKNAADPKQAEIAISNVYTPAIQTLALFGGTIFLAVLLMQILQIRGLLFSTHPVKPDFSRINPGKGLKKIFSARTLKEALKNIFKMSVYLGATYFVIKQSLNMFGTTLTDAQQIIAAFHNSSLRLLFMFTFLALIFAAFDQVIVRNDFLKQMRMSKSEVTRETKDREGEPRMKQKRKQLHAEFVKQTNALGNLEGSDMLIVNPHHYAIALIYDSKSMEAPTVTTKGRNRFALILKQRAFELGIPIIENPPLARALYKTSDLGKEISDSEHQGVASAYLKLYRLKNT